MTHDIFPFVNVFVVTNILTQNYHEFYFTLKFVAFYYTIYHKNKKLVNYVKILRENSIIKVNVHHIVNLNILELDWKEINPTIKEITDRLKNNNIDIEKFKKKLKEENKDKYEEWKDILNELRIK